MGKVTVTRSGNLGLMDKVIINGEEKEFFLDESNDSGIDLILLYIYQLKNFKEHGIKIGMTRCKEGEKFWDAIETRIKEQQKEVALGSDKYEKYGLEREVLYWGICVNVANESFKDYKLHKEIMTRESGICEKEQEWFLGIKAEDIIKIFKDVREEGKKTIFQPRKEQRECVERMKEYFNNHPKGRFLLNCKMRFGKSYTTYKYCEEANINKILILTFVPAVQDSWKGDLLHIERDYKYYTDENLKKDNFVVSEINKPFVLFLSLQNYLGREKDSSVKARIAKLRDVEWDMVILDEYHFGAWNSRTQTTLKNSKEEISEDLDLEFQKVLKHETDVIEKFKIKTEKTVCLSGTPFKILAKGEFNRESSYTYSYFDEQRNKYPEENNREKINPDYAEFPDMKIYGYNMSNLFANATESLFYQEDETGRKYFSLNKFFETKKDDQSDEHSVFIYEEYVKKWLSKISGKAFEYSILNAPFSYDFVEKIQHTLWLMPTQNACEAIERLLKEDSYFRKFKIINLSVSGVGAGANAFRFLEKGIKESENTETKGSIAITVNKLTIGVTVKKWSGVFVLKDLTSPEQYFQAIFRVQTPLKENGKILKKEGLVFDFNIDRAASLLLKYAKEQSEGNFKKLEIARLIVKYLPIFINGDTTKKISEEVFYQLAEWGDVSAKTLSKRITDVSAVTAIDDDQTLADMMNDKEASEILKKVFAHAKFTKPNKETKIPAKSEDGFDTIPAREGIKVGQECGEIDFDMYESYDDEQIQKMVEQRIENYTNEFLKEKKDYDENQKRWYQNGFRKGYFKGLEIPVKKLQCGYPDGKNFVEKVKEKFGSEIKYNDSTRNEINYFMNVYLDKNIPNEYSGVLYKKWYIDSFKRKVRTELTELTNERKKEDVSNILKHILTRLFEFLYISVYRETKFDEILQNAEDKKFLEAVGITKKDFEVINRYNIFNKRILDSYISDFFANETLGKSLSSNEENKKKYRNSFNWFGYGDTEN